MSKIEAALRIAKGERSGTPSGVGPATRDAKVIEGDGFLAQRARTTLPAVVRLEAGANYELDSDVLAKNRIIDHGFPDAALTSYKMLRTRILQNMRTGGWRTLAVTSPRDGAGKSLTATNLAIAMASHGAHDVYLLDLDLKDPQICNYLGLPGFELDVGEYLAGRVSMSKISCNVGIDHLRVLPSSQRQPNSSELLTSQNLQSLLKTILNSASDPIVVIDVPAILTADDALAISPVVDGYLMVVSESETGRDDVSRALEIMRDINVFGVVLNKSVKT